MGLTIASAKKRLFVVWSIGAMLLFLLLIVQSASGRYGDTAEVWAWFLPTIIPTLSLMIAVIVSDALERRSGQKRRADVFLYRVAISLSVFYLVVVSLSIFLQPFSELSPLELMRTSNLWLGPLQGLVVASLGAFFRREAGPGEDG